VIMAGVFEDGFKFRDERKREETIKTWCNERRRALDM
jgi:hypothetical protein